MFWKKKKPVVEKDTKSFRGLDSEELVRIFNSILDERWITVRIFFRSYDFVYNRHSFYADKSTLKGKTEEHVFVGYLDQKRSYTIPVRCNVSFLANLDGCPRTYFSFHNETKYEVKPAGLFRIEGSRLLASDIFSDPDRQEILTNAFICDLDGHILSEFERAFETVRKDRAREFLDVDMRIDDGQTDVPLRVSANGGGERPITICRFNVAERLPGTRETILNPEDWLQSGRWAKY